MPHVLMGALAIPFIVHQNSWYEWSNALWLLDLQTAHVSAYGVPSYFIDAAGSYFYPQQLFYAGPGLSLLAYFALVFGTWPVFAALTAAAFSAASAGVSWTARNLGVSPRLAIIPGVLFASTPYVVSNLYGRGAWAELLAIGGVALALGAATSLLTGRARSQPLVLVVLALSVAWIAGMHNLTLLFTALLAPLLAVALFPILRVAARVALRRYALVFFGAVSGLALVGVFLAPNVWLGGQTVTSHSSRLLLTAINGFDRPSVVFDPILSQPPNAGNTDLHTETLVLPLVWCFGTALAAAFRRRFDARTVLSLTSLTLVGIGITLLIADPHWWLHFPTTLTAIQFPFRLVTYLALLTVLAVAMLLASPAIHRSRTAVGLLLLATAWQVGLATDLAISAKQRGAGVPPTAASVRANVLPLAWAPFQQVEFRLVISHPIPAPSQQASVDPIGDDSPPQISMWGSQPVGSLVATALVSSPLIRVAGDASVAGATVAGLDVLRVNRSPWHVTVSSVCDTCVRALLGQEPLALFLGRLLSVLGCLAILSLFGAEVMRRRKRQSHDR